MAHPTAQEVSVPDKVDGLFALLDEVTRGLAREAALAPEERSARAESILAWFAPRYAAIKTAAAAGLPGSMDRSPCRSGRGCPGARSASLRRLLHAAVPHVEAIAGCS